MHKIHVLKMFDIGCCACQATACCTLNVVSRDPTSCASHSRMFNTSPTMLSWCRSLMTDTQSRSPVMKRASMRCPACSTVV